MLSASERVYLDWHQRMIHKLHNATLTAEQELGLQLWLDSGAKRTEWPGWEIILGQKPFLPVVTTKKQMASAEAKSFLKRGIVA